METNIPPSISEKVGKDLYRIDNHPICIVKQMVFDYFEDLARIEIDNPYVTVENNFDRLHIPKDHPSRSPSDTFYKDDKVVLRTHMTCYLYPLGKSDSGHSQLKYITCGDVYRKDSIDSTHYPVFHQMDAFCIVPPEVDVKKDLRIRLSGLIQHLFGKSCKYKFLEDAEHKDIYFPFTTNSLEVSIESKINNKIKNLEILGAGTVHPDIMNDLGLPDHKAWAFGLGLERLAMIMFDIPDIRLFWSQDKRFLNQFESGKITKFKSFGQNNTSFKDISFYISPSFSYNDLCSIARDEDPHNIIESIVLKDEFNHKGRPSHCYRITYRSMGNPLKISEMNKINKSIRKRLTEELGVELR